MQKWLDSTQDLDLSVPEFQTILKFYLLESPVIEKTRKDKPSPVTCRKKSFDDLGIIGPIKTDLLRRIRAVPANDQTINDAMVFMSSPGTIRKKKAKKNQPSQPAETIEKPAEEPSAAPVKWDFHEEYEKLCRQYKDSSDFEFMIYANTAPSQTDSLFKAIRNAFAHGHFEIRQTESGPLYLLENVTDDGIVKARIRLQEKTLLDMYQIVQTLSRTVLSGEYQQEKELKRKPKKESAQAQQD